MAKKKTVPFNLVGTSIENFKTSAMELASLCDTLISLHVLEDRTESRLKEKVKAFWESLNGPEDE
jgi:hypothetical protein